jgi:TolB-like protein
VISREELIASVWENRAVSDDAVNRCISILRQTLSPQDTHALIETVRRRGYIAHFPPPAETQPTDRQAVETTPGPLQSTEPRNRRSTHLAAALLATAVVAMALWFLRPGRIAESPDEPAFDQPPVVAVLPFATSGRGEDGPFFANGVHDDLLTQLAQVQSLRVISRTSVLEYKESEMNLREIGQELGADAILEGSVQSIAGQIRINVQLIDTLSDAHLWAQTYDRVLSPENLFTVQAEIARAIAVAMHTTLTAQDASRLTILPTDNMAAYRAYHQAMDIRETSSVNDPGYLAALERAVALDPKYLRAWVELAGVLSFQNFSNQDDARVERVEQIIDHIRSEAPDSAEYLIAQAYYTYYILRNYDQAYRLIDQAHTMRPSDLQLVELKSWIARRVGDFDGKIESVRAARLLDPRNPRWTALLVSNLIMAHRYDEASREIASSGVRYYTVAFMETVLELRQHRDFDRWADNVAALQRQFEGDGDPFDEWDALIANRDFAAAAALARGLPEDFGGHWGSLIGLSDKAYVSILSYWFQQSDELLADQLAHSRRLLDEQRTPDGNFPRENQILAWALLTAAAGDAAETVRTVGRWRRQADADLAELSNNRHVACRLLGMVAAVAETVDCIRAALEEPSRAVTFIEPDLPYYDSIRDKPEFIALSAELNSNP